MEFILVVPAWLGDVGKIYKIGSNYWKEYFAALYIVLSFYFNVKKIDRRDLELMLTDTKIILTFLLKLYICDPAPINEAL